MAEAIALTRRTLLASSDLTLATHPFTHASIRPRQKRRNSSDNLKTTELTVR